MQVGEVPTNPPKNLRIRIVWIFLARAAPILKRQKAKEPIT